MISEVVARRYAKALFLATPEAAQENTAKELAGFAGAIASHPQLRDLLTSPVVKPFTKRKIIDGLAGKLRFSDLFTRFLQLLIEMDRMDHIPSVAPAYGAMVDERLERVNATVVLAEEPTRTQARKLADTLKQMTGKKAVNLQTEVDPRLLGGFVIRIGDQVFDASIKNELLRIEKSLAG